MNKDDLMWDDIGSCEFFDENENDYYDDNDDIIEDWDDTEGEED